MREPLTKAREERISAQNLDDGSSVRNGDLFGIIHQRDMPFASTKPCPVRVAAFLAAPLLCATLASYAGAQNVLPKGNVVVAKTAPEMLLIWDASPVIADLVAAKTPEQAARKTLLDDAIVILQSHAATAKASQLELRITYARSGAVSPVYGAATFAGVERVEVLDASRPALLAQAASWRKAVRDGTPTPGLTVKITGQLPPLQ